MINFCPLYNSPEIEFEGDPVALDLRAFIRAFCTLAEGAPRDEKLRFAFRVRPPPDGWPPRGSSTPIKFWSKQYPKAKLRSPLGSATPSKLR